MPWVAKAIHADHVTDAVQELQASGQATFKTENVSCAACGQGYLVIYRDQFDHGNAFYRDALLNKIGEACRNGAHTFDELSITRGRKYG
jgi:hypothetical protein